MTTIATGTPAAPDQTARTAGAQPDWIRPRTTPDGDIMPGEDVAAEDSGLGFGDLLDVINPLQHLPVIGTIYRALTGDTMGEAARMAGGALYGGPFGVIGALANLVVERESGQDIGDTAMAWLTDGPEAGGETGRALADAGPSVPETRAQAINAAPVTIAASNASPAALAAQASPAALAAASGPARDAAKPGAAGEAPATTDFQGRNADRLDAFIQQASAVRRRNPLTLTYRPDAQSATQTAAQSAAAAGRPGIAAGTGSIDAARLQAATLGQPPTMSGRDDQPGGDGREPAASDDGMLPLAGNNAGSVNEWMLQALDKYENLRRQQPS
ncbi:hypothetical protein [Thalassobaculum sp.]|uniref:hypothetical protein n=1 Tax=Thalassobaculum sp. TaxID=2022740 RepID=UPI0032EB50F6